jgi:UDP-N-acetyl-D-galactosamine dehydrogenase
MAPYKICVIGLGYVGLPLARLLSTKHETIGFDMNQRHVDVLITGHDATLEVSGELLQDAINNYGFKCTTNLEDIKDCNEYIVAVPTPVNEDNTPDLKSLLSASETVGKVILPREIIDARL